MKSNETRSNHWNIICLPGIILLAITVFLCACGAKTSDSAVIIPSGLELGTAEEAASAMPSLTESVTVPVITDETPAEPSATFAPAVPSAQSSVGLPTAPVTTADAPAEPPTAPAPAGPSETLPAETSVPSSGIWSAVPTEAADWATRATSDVIYTNKDFGFPTYFSPVDFDGDGIEDQADILQGAKDYVATRPVYDASYFAGGWPPAGRGICADVIAYALLAAGYNIQTLMAKDVAMRPDAYPGTVGDANIDYRRTRNLQPFFETYFEKLTIDPYDYEAWQPGDIVLFADPVNGMWPGHVAVVSDRRAADGLPYLIHHTDNDRFSYEQDFLTTPQRILVGHYRVGNLKDSVLYK